jgi:NTP pyrophosphatase (non-canonical NTP hydrolase)
MGLSSEGGEFNEIVKKLVFQGKQYNEDIKFHLMRELGDIIFYWINACRSLGLDPNKVIEENVNKLQSRYPDGKFNAFQSENRKQGDL